MRDPSDDVSPPPTAPSAAGWVEIVAFAAGLLALGFLAGSFAMYQELFPADALRQAYQAGFALHDKLTRYRDPLATDLWRPARTAARGVTRHDPARAQDGLTLYTSGHDQRAFLIDMAGRVVHEWALPFSRIWDESAAARNPQPDEYIYIEKAKLLPNGDLLALYVAVGDTPWGYGLAKLDRDSNLLWKYLAHAHHDFDVGAQGNIHVLTHEIASAELPPGYEYLRPPRIDDFLVTLSADGAELAKIWLTGALAGSPAGRWLNIVPWYVFEGSGDYLHTNSVDIIDRPLAGVPESRPGQVLLSFREISTLGLLDLASERVVWALRGSWLRQHDADLLPSGHILLFDNEGNLGEHGRSRVLELHPATEAIVWSYAGSASDPFESRVRSSQDRLPNGNTLIVESDAGRVLEVTPEGDIVWEFVNPVRAGPGNERIPIIFWVDRLDPASLDPSFRDRLRS